MPADDSTEIDQDQIDLLVRELMTRRRVGPPAAPVVSQSAARPESEPPAVVLEAAPETERRKGRRWSNVRLLMPSMRHAHPEPRLTSAAAISLPHLPDVSRFFRAPGPATQVRLWVALSVVYSVALSFWPYPKTYLWGMVLYLLSLGLVLVSGVWGARLSWDARLGAAHTVSIGTVFWAVTLATVEAIPKG